ncbi:hypothetical protein ABZ860_05145 [Microbispora sp. NPDC046973]|uniref:hypothetical protein n=1 Tax=Microbispora sp. NPDC046973 TaxID=3155022 RepID=UPI0033C7F005
MVRTLGSLTDRMLSTVVPTAEAQAVSKCVVIGTEQVSCTGGVYPFTTGTVTKKLCVDFEAKTITLEKSSTC